MEGDSCDVEQPQLSPQVLSLAHSAPKPLSSDDGGEERKRPDTKHEERRREKPPSKKGKGLPRWH